MKKTYQIEDDFANYANLMDEATKKTEGVADAVVNFMIQKMTVEFAEGQDPKGYSFIPANDLCCQTCWFVSFL